ncbi:MAG: transporter substrate-binding domain-containing protein [Clostridia bacterium]|nr:transporter substrate-binding domain-containing protein [Clostridia bacterium]
MKHKKSTIVISLLLVLALALLAGCGGEKTQSTTAPDDLTAGDVDVTEADDGKTEADGLLAEIKANGYITIAMEGTWAPWTYHDEDDTLVGYDVEVGQKIAEALGVHPRFIEGEWDGLLAGLEAARYDIMINGVDITPEREEKYAFSTPYAYNRTAVIVRSDDERITKMEDLDGMNTANTISSTYAEVAEKYGANVTGVDDLNQTMELLLSGRIDATLNAEVTYYDYMKAHPDAGLKIAVIDLDSTSVAIPMRKGAETQSLLAAVNDALETMRQDGTLKALSEKYFGTDISSQ